MKLSIYAKNMQLTDALKEAAIKKIKRLDKFFQQDIEAKIVLSIEKKLHKVEVTIPFNGRIVRVEESSDDMYNAVDEAVESLERQIRKHKTKLQNKKHSNESIKFENIEPLDIEDDQEFKVVKTKRFAIKPMGIEEAILQMDLLKHNFFVFLNGDSEEVNVVYKRKDGNYGLIEPEL
ncbi:MULTISPECIES: ribosome hibernation-promoting factor, HPF/YfiA family [Sedimentibacter]|uniref:Ribosome hibernation promoting factor n=1 Tax=Sedimentibacter hydroxybenzoicus DSM 7310 TaxID=1123245 RepID=A0A974BJX0_SEDHY|nr:MULTISPECIES: ribosome-associated translation inhibitor RaiA [Sedimentibacter]NYB74640.1 ribosome-associated translation inhibitor RaiA [Sedimentibacter hydroxybenzoicus DSM 7310]